MLGGSGGVALLASLALARGLTSADAAAVRVAGRELPAVCVSRLLLGVNCPGCGMTRSVLMTLGGDLSGALSVNPGGPLLVAALLLVGAQLLFMASRGGDAAGDSATRRLLPWASVYAAAVASAMLIHWAGAFAGA